MTAKPQEKGKTSQRIPCNLTMNVSIKRGNAEWEAAQEREEVASGHVVEVTVDCNCRATIDIKPDRIWPLKNIEWKELVFAPERRVKTRHKVAYYRARKVLRRTEVEFVAKAKCRCAECVGEPELKFTLIYDERAKI